MSKTQLWTTIILGSFVILFILQAVLSNDEADNPDNAPSNVEQNSSDNQAVALYNNLGCVTCHGEDLSGTPMGPSLKSISEFYSRNELISYLQNPASFMDTERFLKFKEQYRTVMPSFSNRDIKELGIISDYILKLK